MSYRIQSSTSYPPYLAIYNADSIQNIPVTGNTGPLVQGSTLIYDATTRVWCYGPSSITGYTGPTGLSASPSLQITTSYQVTLSNILHPVVKSSNPADATVLYTVPPSRQAIVSGCIISSTGAATCNIDYSIGGVICKTPSVIIAGANLISTTGLSNPIILNAADTVTWRTTAANACPRVMIEEFDPVSGLTTSALGSLSIGDNTIYTVGVGKKALLVSSTYNFLNGTPIVYVNYSGVNRAVNLQIVPNGGTPGNENYIAINGTVGTGIQLPSTAVQSVCNIPYSLNAGDFVVVNTDANTATQCAWVNYYEYI